MVKKIIYNIGAVLLRGCILIIARFSLWTDRNWEYTRRETQLMYQYFTPRKVLFPPLNMGHDTLILFERNTAEAVLSSYVEWGEIASYSRRSGCISGRFAGDIYGGETSLLRNSNTSTLEILNAHRAFIEEENIFYSRPAGYCFWIIARRIIKRLIDI